MKILHINTYDQGGAAIAAIRLHKALLSQGVDSSILFLEQGKKNIPHSNCYVDYNKINRKFLCRQFYKLRRIFFPKSEKKYINRVKLLNRIEGFDSFSFNPCDPDISSQKICQQANIIHLHWTAGFVDYKILKKLGKPIVWTLHDMNPFTGGCHYSNNCNKFKNDCIACPQLIGTKNINNSYFDQNYKKKCLLSVSPVITSPSLWLKSCSEQSSVFKEYETIHIPYSLDLSIFKPQNQDFCKKVFDLEDEKRTILFVSEDINNIRKGFNLLLEALNKTESKNIQICVIGENRKSIQNKFNIVYLGKISDERLISIAYSAADVLIIPSMEDNLPNVMLESLACGTPVIAFPVGGMREVIKTGLNGILSREVNSDSLSIAIKEFIENKYVFNRKIISMAARKAFSPAQQAKLYISLYNKILDINRV